MPKKGKSMRRGSSNNPRIEKIIKKQQRPSSRRTPISASDQLPHHSSFHGYIFMCNGNTKSDCFKFRVFGLPAARMDILDNIRPGMKLFLFDFDLRLLYGIYEPASKGEMSIVPTAFGGRFSAQVRFQVYKDCLPLPESVFRPLIKDNYQGSKFRQELTIEHVQNLISLFRPVDMSPSQGFVSPKRNDEPLGYGVYSRPGEGQRSQHIRHIEEPLLHVSHASVRIQPQLQQYSSDEAHQAYLREEELYNRCAAVRDDQSRLINRNSIAEAHRNSPSQLSIPSQGRYSHLSLKPFSAAYWISVANESLQKEMHTHPFQGTPSASTGMAAPSQTPPIEEREAPIISHHPPPENNDTSLAATTSLVVQPQAEDGPTHIATSSSSVPGYWTPVTSQDPNQVCFDHSQWQQTANTGIYIENAPTYAVQTGPNQYVADTGITFDNYNHHGTIIGTNSVLVQTHDPTVYYCGPSGVLAQAYDMPEAYYPSQASDLAAYYSGTTTIHPQEHNSTTAYYYTNIGIPTQAHEVAAYYCANTDVPGQTHELAAYHLQENSYRYSNVPSSSQAPANWDPNQVGVTHFHQQMIPSGNSINSLGGEHLTVSHPGAANTVPANGQ